MTTYSDPWMQLTAEIATAPHQLSALEGVQYLRDFGHGAANSNVDVRSANARKSFSTDPTLARLEEMQKIRDASANKSRRNRRNSSRKRNW